MLTGIIFTLLGSTCFAVGNNVQKLISLKFSVIQALVFQYFFIGIFGFLFLLFFGTFSVNLTLEVFLIIAFAGIIGYLGIFFFILALKKVPIWVALIIGNTYSIFGYFINYFLFQQVEGFSIGKLIVAFMLFLSISIFVFEKNHEGKMKFNKNMMFPFLTSICWSIYFSLSNYLIKTKVFSPGQNVFYLETTIFLVAIIVFIFIKFRKNNKIISFKSENIKNLLIYISWSFLTFAGSLFLFMAYSKIAGNLVNFINLSDIIITTILAYIFFKEKINAKQIITISISFLLLVLFVFIK